MVKTNDILKKAEQALLEIIRGYSILRNGNEEFYFRHYSVLEDLELEESYRNFLQSAIKSGIKDEKTILAEAVKKKRWSVQKEEEMKSLQWEMDKLSEVAKKIEDPTQKQSALLSVEDKKKQLVVLDKERREICSYSAEYFAEMKKVKALLSSCVYKDRGLKIQASEKESAACAQQFFERISEFNNLDVIANAAYNTHFFDLFSLNYRQPYVLFKQRGVELTIFQKTLLSYSNAILNRLKNISIPEKILKDPVKILNYKEPEHKDDGQTTHGIEDLKRKSAAKGGKLDADDFLT